MALEVYPMLWLFPWRTGWAVRIWGILMDLLGWSFIGADLIRQLGGTQYQSEPNQLG